MKMLKAALLGVIVSATALASVSPALSLGGCGPNGHRNAWGRCVWGGQNQRWCLRHTGRPAVRMPNGTVVCPR